GEIPTTQILNQFGAEHDLGFTRVRVVLLVPVRGDLHGPVSVAGANRAKRSTDVPLCMGPAGQNLLDLFGFGIGSEVQIRNRGTQEHIAHRTTNQGQLEADISKPCPKVHNEFWQGDVGWETGWQVHGGLDEVAGIRHEVSTYSIR